MQARQLEGVKYFLSAGYSLKQSVGIMAGLIFKSRLNETGVEVSGEDNPLGIAGWENERKLILKNFSNDWSKYATQLVFTKFELNSSQAAANIRLRKTDTNEKGLKNNCQRVFAKYYLGVKKESDFESVERLCIGLQELIGE
jgi:hypothetical protein